MKALRRLWRRLAGTIVTKGIEDELSAEIEAHLQAQTEDNMRAGMPVAQARRAALVKFGGVESAKEQYRDERRLPPIDTLVQDLRFALRSCGNRPAFSAVVVLSLAIGIGINTTIFTWLKAVYLNPLPGVTDARRLVTINAAYKFGDGYSNSYQDFVYIRDHSRLFAGLFAHEMETLAVSDGKSAEMTMGGIVSGNYFDVLNTNIAIGRGFRPEEDRVSDRDAVIVLGDGGYGAVDLALTAIFSAKESSSTRFRLPSSVLPLHASWASTAAFGRIFGFRCTWPRHLIRITRIR